MKEITIIVTILTGILWGNFSALNCLKTNSEELSNKLIELKENINEEDKINEIYDKWKEEKSKLAVILEHNYMDKIELELIAIKTALEKNETGEIMQKIDRTVFLLNDMKERHEIKLKNIF